MTIGVVLVSGALGGAWAHFGATGDVVPPGQLYSMARDGLRGTMRRMDKRYYERGEAYAACIGGYGIAAANLTMSERVWSCECVDKSVDNLSRANRESALAYVANTTPAAEKLTISAARMLNRCEIDTADKSALDLDLPLRGTR